MNGTANQDGVLHPSSEHRALFACIMSRRQMRIS